MAVIWNKMVPKKVNAISQYRCEINDVILYMRECLIGKAQYIHEGNVMGLKM